MELRIIIDTSANIGHISGLVRALLASFRNLWTLSPPAATNTTIRIVGVVRVIRVVWKVGIIRVIWKVRIIGKIGIIRVAGKWAMGMTRCLC